MRRGATAGPLATFAAAALIIASVVLTYAGSLDGGFVSDDHTAIANNPLLRSLDRDTVGRILSSFDDENYIPLKVLSLAIDQRIWGPAPFGYHLTNVLLHAACALLVWRILLRLAFSNGAALLGALLWALHPLQVESVAFMSERKNVLSGAFFFAAFLGYLRYRAGGRRRAYLGLLLLFLLALLSKMNTVVLPALCVAYDAIVARRLDRRTVLAVLPLLGLGALVVWYNLTGSTLHGALRFHGGSAAVTWLTSAIVVFRYLGAAALPLSLRNFYHVPLHGSLADPPVALALLGLVALLGLTIWLAFRAPREGFWLLWFGITLAPMLNIIPFPTLMQDRYMYLPLLGLVAAPVGALDRVLRLPTARRTAAAVAVVICAAWAALSVRQVAAWTDDLSLWREWALQEWYLPVDVGPRRGPDSEERLAILSDAARAAPDSVIIRHNLGALLYERGDLAPARVELEAAQALATEDEGPLLTNLGRVYLRSGDPARAAVVLRRAVAAEPYSFFAQLNLARATLAIGDTPTAAAALAACARIRPDRVRLFATEQQQLERLQATPAAVP